MNNRTFLSGLLVAIAATVSLIMEPIHASESKSIAVYGASGRIGQVIVVEALERGYKVTGLSRSPEKLQVKHKNFTAAKGDLLDVSSIKTIASNHDAIVISVNARAPDNKPENSLLVKFTRNIHEALSDLDKKPYILQVGGANLMYGTTYDEVKKNAPEVPFPYEVGTPMHAVLFGHQISLDMYRANDLSWTVLAPPITILGIYGELDKTSTRPSYRVSASDVPLDSEGKSIIYVRDLAKAAMTEIEEKKFERQVFTVGY